MKRFLPCLLYERRSDIARPCVVLILYGPKGVDLDIFCVELLHFSHVFFILAMYNLNKSEDDMSVRVFTNGIVYTMVPGTQAADTVALEDGRIVFVGAQSDAAALMCADDVEIRDLNGRTVMPGFVDSHVHPAAVAQSKWHVALPKTNDTGELLRFMKVYAQTHPPDEIPFLYFEYYPTEMFGDKGPTKELLDTAVSDRPCLVQDWGDHLHWVNSKMIESLGVDKNIPDPIPGHEVFVRNSDGEPTGWIKEMAWLRFSENLYRSIGWKPPTDFTTDLLSPVFDFMVRHGVTALFDAMIENESHIDAVRRLDDEARLNLFYGGCVRFYRRADLDEKIELLLKYREKYATRHIRLDTMKLFLDGTNESGNSAVLRPFINDGSGTNFGNLNMDASELADCLRRCNEADVDLHVHVVGDRGFRVACDALETARLDGAPSWTTRLTLAHCELIDPDDVSRAAALGIFINCTPHWLGGHFGETAKLYLGKERWERMYSYRGLLDAGCPVAFSSDVISFYELHRQAPLFGIQVAATRVDPELEIGVRPPESERLSVSDLLFGYTRVGAEQMRRSDTFGSVEPGKVANLVILSEDPLTSPVCDLANIGIEAVIFEGRCVSGRI
jgi:predicted amidohydrolase YtcJ